LLRRGMPTIIFLHLGKFQPAKVGNIQPALTLSNDKAFKPLLQAMRELAVRDKQDGERRLVEALATQLRMNRKTIMVANEMKEVPLFDSVENIGQVLIN
jgi:hypothetical protein